MQTWHKALHGKFQVCSRSPLLGKSLWHSGFLANTVEFYLALWLSKETYLNYILCSHPCSRDKYYLQVYSVDHFFHLKNVMLDRPKKKCQGHNKWILQHKLIFSHFTFIERQGTQHLLGGQWEFFSYSSCLKTSKVEHTKGLVWSKHFFFNNWTELSAR